MTLAVAYWCVLIAALLPYLWVVVAKTRGERYNNHDPRGWLQRQESRLVRRANGAHLNAFEAFAPFAAGVVSQNHWNVRRSRSSNTARCDAGSAA